ncbi:MAG: ABC transporter ATP-binding protein [Faecousia sp.]
MSKPLLEIRSLRTSFHTRGRMVQAVRGIDLTVHEGEILGIVGESGSGKSVSMKSVIRLVPPSAEVTADSIRLDGMELTALSDKQMCGIRGSSISMIFQDPMTSLDPLKRVGAHIEEVLHRHLKMSGAEARQEAISLLRKVGVPSPETRVKQYPHEFSGGMRQRVLIAMALACHPRLLIADEPTTALDVTIQAQILDLIQNLQRQEKMSVILITHDLGVVAQLCRRVAVMYAGLILEEGTADEIFEFPAHPYTRALLRSIPSIDEADGRRLQPIEGHAPSLLSPPPGCPFAPRCPYAAPACGERIPVMVRLTETHQTRCPFHIKEETP